MWQSAHDAYLESRILSADPVELVRMLYQAAMDAVREARRHLANGEIMERSRAITKAGEIIRELAASLDYERGGEISTTLGRLYEYMQHKLLEANLRQSDPPMAEVLGLLATVAEGWGGLRDQKAEQPSPTSQQGPWAQPMFDDAAAATSSHAWSL
jgi:flagellar protein FliS